MESFLAVVGLISLFLIFFALGYFAKTALKTLRKKLSIKRITAWLRKLRRLFFS